MALSKRKRPSISPHEAVQLDYTHLIPGTILPPTFIQGPIRIVWGKGDVQKSKSPSPAISNSSVSSNNELIPKIGFTLAQKYQISKGYQPNDYVLPTEKETTETYEITIRLFHSQLNPTYKDLGSVNSVKALIDEAYLWLKSMSKGIWMETTGLEVISKSRVEGKSIWAVVLQGVGERELKTDDKKQSRILMPDFPKPSQPPDWFSSSAPIVSSPPRPPSQLPTPTTTPGPPNTSRKGESKLRPITSFHPPDLTRHPSKSSTKSSSSHLARSNKRSSLSLEPGKEEDVKRTKSNEANGHSVKLPNLPSTPIVGAVASKDIEAVKEKSPRTVVQLGPPGTQASVREATAPSSNTVNKKLEEHVTPHDESPNPVETPVSTESVPQEPILSEVNVAQISNTAHDALGIPVAQAQAPITPMTTHTVEVQDTLFKQMTPIRRRSHVGSKSDAASSPCLPCREQSVPTISQSSPVFSTQAEHSQLAIARQRAEKDRRAQLQSAQAESSRTAQLGARNLNRLEEPLRISGLEYTPLKRLESQRIANIVGVVVKLTHVSKPSASLDDF
uniref:Uncharacterized protein n=1 Tax=Kwoniella pini CBS 10737 TaxID=1296096 RepID=A0A1B9HWX5_9TREE|nr:uncharacterized protein I206_06676 [Kwoniella pini CBS 10737]OCF47769.1 hypothetical protein I206_06676 [Kwoniella pini CBS 10737]